MKEFKETKFVGERACFATQGAHFDGCIFADGESPLKESSDLELRACMFRWKYPLWYCKNVVIEDSSWFEMARSGVWYTHAAETLWSCDNVKMKNVRAKGDYFAMNSGNMEIDGLELDGNYGFDGLKNATVRNSRLLSKDSFWNSENVTVYDSFISGEYLGWNSKNLTLINCTIESLQGM